MSKNLFFTLGALTLLSPLSTFAFFSDVPEGHENKEAIEWSASNNVVGGYPDGSFKPDQEINRAEFTKIIVEAVTEESEIYGSHCFTDITDEWFAKYVCTAKRLELIDGYPDGSFKPEQNISFVESAKIIANGLSNEVFEEDTELWFRPFVQYLSDRNAIPVSILELDKKILRGEMVEVVWRVNKYPGLYKANSYYSNHRNILVYLEPLGGCYKYDSYSKKIYSVCLPEISGFLEYGYGNKHSQYVSLLNIDKNSFKHVSWYYGLDTKNKIIYYDEKKIGPYVGEVKNIFNPTGYWGEFWGEFSPYVKDDKSVFYREYIIDGADPKTFEALGPDNTPGAGGQIFLPPFYGKDKNNIYFGKDILNVDLGAFLYVGDGYAKDINTVLLNGKKITNADPETFQIIENSELYDAEDANNYYWNGIPMPKTGTSSDMKSDGFVNAQLDKNYGTEYKVPVGVWIDEEFLKLEEDIPSIVKSYINHMNDIYASGQKDIGRDNINKISFTLADEKIRYFSANTSNIPSFNNATWIQELHWELKKSIDTLETPAKVNILFTTKDLVDFDYDANDPNHTKRDENGNIIWHYMGGASNGVGQGQSIIKIDPNAYKNGQLGKQYNEDWWGLISAHEVGHAMGVGTHTSTKFDIMCCDENVQYTTEPGNNPATTFSLCQNSYDAIVSNNGNATDTYTDWFSTVENPITNEIWNFEQISNFLNTIN